MNLASVGIQMIRDNLTKEDVTTTGKTANSLKGEDTGFRLVSQYADDNEVVLGQKTVIWQ